MIEVNDIDICCLQDCYTNEKILIDIFNTKSTINTNFTINTTYLSNLGIVLIYKKKLVISNTSIVLKSNKSSSLIFDFNGKKYCVVRLDIGKPLKDRSNSLYEPSVLLNIISFNSNNKINEINKIIIHDPDYILGNFSFTKEDKPFKHLINNNYKTELLLYTTIDNVQTDFIFSKVKYNSLNTFQSLFLSALSKAICKLHCLYSSGIFSLCLCKYLCSLILAKKMFIFLYLNLDIKKIHINQFFK